MKRLPGGQITHGMSDTRLYYILHGMKQRCFNENNKGYRYYGARGIKVCKEWMKFETFYKWAMSNGYTDEMSIERIDYNGDYHPGNCKWIPLNEQQHNKRKATNNGLKGEKNNKAKLKDVDVRVIKDKILDGIKLADIAREYGVSRNTICDIKTNKTWRHIK